MIITSHTVCTPIVDIGNDGSVRIARMTYELENDNKRFSSISIRHVMEGGKNGQSVLETLADAVFSEAWDQNAKFRLVKVLSEEPVFLEFADDERHPGGIHLKIVFPVYVPEKYLRKHKAADRDDPDEVHGALSMVLVEDWLREARKTVPFHRDATIAVLLWAAKKNPKVNDRYCDIIWEWEKIKLTDEQERAIVVYTKRWPDYFPASIAA